MNKKFFIAWAVLFVVWMLGSFFVHGFLLHDDYARLPNLMRAEKDAQGLFHFMILAHVMLSGALAWMYRRGANPAKPWADQGLRFGFVLAFLTVVPTYAIYYVVQPTPGMLAVKQILFDSALMLVLGVVAAFLYRAPQATSPA